MSAYARRYWVGMFVAGIAAFISSVAVITLLLPLLLVAAPFWVLAILLWSRAERLRPPPVEPDPEPDDWEKRDDPRDRVRFQ